MNSKKIILSFLLCVPAMLGFAQQFPIEQLAMGTNLAGDNYENLKIVYVNKDVSTHFISMENVQYVDISTQDIVGDLPTSNTLRVKPLKEGASGIVTIVTERFLVQYLLVYNFDLGSVYSKYNIPYSDLQSYVNPETNMTKSEMYNYAYNMFVSPSKYYNVSTKKNKLKLTLNNIYTMSKYFFLDVSLLNKTNIQYDIDQIRFKIEDKKQTKATNFQSIELLPVLTLDDKKFFKKNYRNIFVFEKFTFPDEKVFTIEISEKQISGRTIILRVNYSDLLHADAFNQ